MQLHICNFKYCLFTHYGVAVTLIPGEMPLIKYAVQAGRVVWGCAANICTCALLCWCGSSIQMHVNRHHLLSPMICTHQCNIQAHSDNSTEGSLATAAKNIPAPTHSLPARNTKNNCNSRTHLCREDKGLQPLPVEVKHWDREKHYWGGNNHSIPIKALYKLP